MKTYVSSACLCLVATLSCATSASAGRFASLIAASALDTRAVPRPAPAPIAPEDQRCDNCDGTGKVGDGRIVKTCPVCGGTGRKAKAVSQLTAAQQPTPWPGVAALLNVAKPLPSEVVLDPGCGADARLLIDACRYFGVEHCVGVEIDPEIANMAREAVKTAGLSDKIEIVTGDATALDLKADVVVGYMYPEFWKAFQPQFSKFKRVVSYQYDPGLRATKLSAPDGAAIYSWINPPPTTQVPIVRTTTQTVQLPRGSYCEVCGGYCRNPMAHVQQQQVIGYQTVPTTSKAATSVLEQAQSPRYREVTRKVCDGHGHCHLETMQVPY